QTSHVAIHSGDNRFRIAVARRVRTNQADQVSDPHSRGESFAADVAEREHQTFIRLFDTEEIARQMTNGKNLARHIERSVTHETRRTQTPVYLCGFEDRSVQLRVIALQPFELQFHFR